MSRYCTCFCCGHSPSHSCCCGYAPVFCPPRSPSPAHVLSPSQEYIDQHSLQKVVEDVLNGCVKTKPEEPLTFMVRAAEHSALIWPSIHCTQQQFCCAAAAQLVGVSSGQQRPALHQQLGQSSVHTAGQRDAREPPNATLDAATDRKEGLRRDRRWHSTRSSRFTAGHNLPIHLATRSPPQRTLGVFSPPPPHSKPLFHHPSLPTSHSPTHPTTTTNRLRSC